MTANPRIEIIENPFELFSRSELSVTPVLWRLEAIVQEIN
jgi:hypothetical protein